MKLNNTHGFKVLRTVNNEDIDSEIVELEHERSGARLIAVLNEDPNKVFYIGFRTPSDNATGVAHILEHSTLCGSKKYPLKEPFVELAKGSLNTFLNAMTYPDKTVYPIASTNDKDFRNLTDVYLDAVFNPNIYNNPYTFKQEGWHYHLEDVDEPVTINGVVYNEMKGVYSDPGALLEEEVFKAVYPDTIYSKDSGGNPNTIPELSYEDFLNFHSTYYHPSNSYIYLYGDIDLEEQLEYLNSWLENYERMPVNSQVPLQEPVINEEIITARYPVSKEEDLKNKDILGISYVLDENYSPEDMIAIGILVDLLFNRNASPIKQQLLDEKLVEDIKASLIASLRQPNLFLELTNTDEKNVGRIVEIINKSLKEMVENGIDADYLQSGINSEEFRTLEVLSGESGRTPKGLIIGLQLLEDWVYDRDPLRKIDIGRSFEYLEKLAENGGFEELIKKVFLDNTFKASVLLKPDLEVLKEREEALRTKLDDYKASLTREELDELVEDTNELLRRQQQVDSPEDLKLIPRLSVDEIDRKIKEITWEELDLDGVPVVYLDEGNRDIVYIDLNFDVSSLSEDELYYLSLYAMLLTNISTENMTFKELDTQLDLYTGGEDIITESDENVITKEVQTNFSVRLAFREAYMDKALGLLKEFLLRTRFDEQKLIHDLLVEERISKKQAIQNFGNAFAALRTKAGTSPTDRIAERLGGLEFYDFLVKLTDDFENKWDTVKEKLQTIQDKLINKNNLLIGYSCKKKYSKDVLEGLRGLLEEIPNETYEKKELNLESLPQNEAFITQGNVMYNAKGGRVEPDQELRGAFKVLGTLLSMDYLWNTIRVIGGAYGTAFKATREGDIIFSSFRDPNLKKTYDSFDNVVKYIDSLDLSPEELGKYIVGTISPLEVPISTKNKLYTAVKMYRTGLTDEDRQLVREQILDTQLDDLKKTGRILKEALDEDRYVTIGTVSQINDNKDLFKAVQHVQ